MRFGKFEQVGGSSLPRELFAGLGEGNDNAGFNCSGITRHGNRYELPALDGRRAERLEVNARIRHTPIFQRRHEALQHRCGAANIEMVRLERQLYAQQIHIDAPPVLMILRGHIFRQRVAETQPQMKIRMRRRQRFELRFHHQLPAVAHAVEQPDLASRLFGQTPVQHAQHRRDADAASDQHHRGIAAVEIKMAGGCPHLQETADRDLIVKIIG
jgi:hypothetical protein